MIVNTTGLSAQTLWGLLNRYQARCDVLSAINATIEAANENRPEEEQQELETVPTWQEFLDSEFLARATEANQVLQAEANDQLAAFVNALPQSTIDALKAQFGVPNLIRDEFLQLIDN